jgi:hypothetical protein
LVPGVVVLCALSLPRSSIGADHILRQWKTNLSAINLSAQYGKADGTTAARRNLDHSPALRPQPEETSSRLYLDRGLQTGIFFMDALFAFQNCVH